MSFLLLPSLSQVFLSFKKTLPFLQTIARLRSLSILVYYFVGCFSILALTFTRISSTLILSSRSRQFQYFIKIRIYFTVYMTANITSAEVMPTDFCSVWLIPVGRYPYSYEYTKRGHLNYGFIGNLKSSGCSVQLAIFIIIKTILFKSFEE